MKRGTRNLFVEDDRYIARLLKLELEHQNLKVQCAYDGPSAQLLTTPLPRPVARLWRV